MRYAGAFTGLRAAAHENIGALWAAKGAAGVFIQDDTRQLPGVEHQSELSASRFDAMALSARMQ